MPRPKPARRLISEYNVAQRVAYEREKRGWSYAGLASRMTKVGCTIDQSALYKIEKADPPRRITVDELVGFSEVFGLSLTELTTPLDVVVSDTTLELINKCRQAYEATDAAFDVLIGHVISHPKAREVFEQEWSEWDRYHFGRILSDKVRGGMERIFRNFEEKHGRPMTIEDMDAAEKQVAESKKRGRR